VPLVLLFAALAAVAAPAAAPLSISLQADGTDGLVAVLTGDAEGAPAGEFVGTISVNGSAATLPVRAEAERAGDRLRVPAAVKYAEVPADWADRFRPGAFDYRVRGIVAGRDRVEWSGSLPWNAVGVHGDRELASRFVRLVTLELTRFSLIESEARASVAVRNPFAFPLKLSSARYRLYANGREVGSGETGGLLLHPKQENRLDFPIDIAHGSLLAAAGSALASGGRIEGRLAAELTVRLPGGDIAVPLDLTGDLALLSE
jgi:LEA14-like dessication related protein